MLDPLLILKVKCRTKELRIKLGKKALKKEVVSGKLW
jgi:hypothetical protein